MGTFPDLPDTIVDDLQFIYSSENYGFYIQNQPPSDIRYYRDNSLVIVIIFSGHIQQVNKTPVMLFGNQCF